MATKVKAKKMDLSKGVDMIKSTTKDVNDFVLETSEELLNVAIKRGSQWQVIGDKAIKCGLKLAANQQDIVFTTLESLKGQVMTGSKRFKGLFSKN